METKIQCPYCKSYRTNIIGKLPNVDEFTGKKNKWLKEVSDQCHKFALFL